MYLKIVQLQVQYCVSALTKIHNLYVRGVELQYSNFCIYEM